MTRRPATTPEAVASEMSRVRRMAERIADMAQVVVDEYAELNDGAYRKFDQSGQLEPLGRGNLHDVDPTGATATSGRHQRMRTQMVETNKHFSKIRPHLEKALNQMLEAWMELDPDERDRLRRRRELEMEYEAIEATRKRA